MHKPLLPADDYDETDTKNDQFNHIITDEVIPPDGRYAWVICAVVWSLNFVVLGILYSTAIFLLPISEDLNVGRGEISLIFSAGNGLVFLLGAIGGTLSDRFGVRWVVFSGGCIAAVGLCLSSFCDSVWQVGWRTAFIMISEFLAVSLIICSLPLKRRTPTVKKGEFAEVIKHLKSRPFIILFCTSFFNSFAYFIPFGHLVSYAQDMNVDEKNATLILSFMGVASIFGRVIIGFVSDKIERRRILQVSLLIMAIASYMWYFATDFISIMSFAFVYGFIAGSVVSVITPLIADYFGINTLGTMTSFTMTITGVGNVIGSPVAGFIYDYNGSYTIGIILCGSAFLISFILLLFLPAPPKKVVVATVIPEA